ncbi:ycaO-like family protein [Brevibacillus laterosporus GI-9]|nr:ycaO-like family protein [Brevibacillus laterosporus GI-9]
MQRISFTVQGGEADKFLQLVEEKIERFDQRAFEFLGILYDDREIKVTASPNDSLKEVMDFISRFIEIEERSAYCKETPHLGTLYTYWADMKYKCNELDEAQVLEKLVQPMVGLISRVDHLPISPGEPEFPIHLSSLGDISHSLTQIKRATQGRYISGGMDGAGGSTDVAESRIRSMAEGLERYSSCTYDERQFIWATADELGDDALDLRKVPVCSDAELRHPKCGVINPVTDAPIRWVKGISLLDQREVWVPAIMTYLHLSTESMGERFWLPISTGCATHESIEEALISAICEVIERDAISLTWLQQLSLPHIEFDEMELGSKTMP